MAKSKKILTTVLTVLALFLLGLSAIFYHGGVGVKADANTNIALGKPVRSTSGNRDFALTDGKKDAFWEAEPYPATFEVDLEDCYAVTGIKIFPYSDGKRYYNYQIDYSADGANYTAFASKTDKTPESAEGTYYGAPNGSAVVRYIRVKMTYNSANTAVHVFEIEAYGEKTEYSQEMPKVDPLDSSNVAYGKKVTSNLPFMDAGKLTDGSLTSYWQAKFTPVNVDVDLGENYLVEDIVLFFPEGSGYFNYTVYGGTDGDKFERIYRKHDKEMPAAGGDIIKADGKEYRYIRVYLEYEYMTNGVTMSEIRVHGSATGKNKGTLREGGIEEILGVKAFSETEYAKPVSQEETIANVYGIIERTVGKKYCSWFEFKLTGQRNGQDYYELSDTDNGKILITGNSGVSLASGVNFYFKNYAKVNITEQANQVLMPRSIVPVGKTVSRETPYKVRYAFNYCTMAYSFAFFDEADFRREYDWLALNGVNLVLDLAGQEAVWIQFLMNFGYSYDAAKAWLCGPTYYAWQFMDNMEIFGGNVTDAYVKERLESARRMQRWRLSLGMETCLQGYTGMIPNDFKDYQPNVDILEQGQWNGLDRPDMIRTDTEVYDEYARLFYEAQEWAFGATGNYYAADPFHEGGIRPLDLNDDVIAEEVLNSLLEYDKDGVWVIQAWHSNPSNLLLRGLGERKNEHALILDLCGLEAPKWNRTTYGEDGEGGMTIDAVEFNATPWVWCMLENYGGNPSMDGELEAMVTRLDEARENARCMVGIGIIPEASLDNPVIYNMIFDMAWSSFTVDDWLDDYIEARYGRASESAREAWSILKNTVYKKDYWYRTTPWVVTNIPEWTGKQTVPYDVNDLTVALVYLLDDFNTLSISEGYRYDLVELMRQIANDYSVLAYNDVLSAYERKNVAAFEEAREKFLNTFDVMDAVLACRSEWLAGEWIGKAEDWGNAFNDDYVYDSFVNDSKLLITTWADMIALRCIPDYAQRNYQGMLIDLYKTRWEVYLDKLQANLTDKTPVQKLGTDDYYHVYMQWIMQDHEYTRTPNDSIENLWNVALRLLKELPENSLSVSAKEPKTTLLNEYITRYKDIQRDVYTKEQLALLDEVKDKAEALRTSPERSEYLALLSKIQRAYAVIASVADSPKEDDTTITPPDPETPAKKKNNGLAIGLGVGGGVAAVAAGAAAYVLVKKKKNGKDE